MWTSVSQLAEGGPISTEPIFQPPDQIAQRQLMQAQLARTVLERYVPRADDLPFSEVLELRRKCASELEAFRVGIRQFATEVDLTRSPAELDLQLQDLVSRAIDPAVLELERSLTSARWNILKKLMTKESFMRAALIGVAVALLPGSPLDIQSTVELQAGAAVVSAVAEAEIERANILRASQWSILFRLTRLQRLKLERSKQGQDPFSVGP